MRHSNTLAEALKSVSDLHHIVDRSYQEMSNRIQGLELRETQRMSSRASIVAWRDPKSATSRTLTYANANHSDDQETAPISRTSIFAPDFVAVLKQSWVYARNSAFRTSTFSSGRQSMAWSCLSSLSVSEISNISVFNLAITLDEVTNPERLSQTWSNDQIEPVWLQLPPSTTHPGSHVRSLSPPLPSIGIASDVLPVHTETKAFEGTGTSPSIDEAPMVNLGSNVGHVTNSKAESEDCAKNHKPDYPCTGCGEVSHISRTTYASLLYVLEAWDVAINAYFNISTRSFRNAKLLSSVRTVPMSQAKHK